MSDLSPAPTLRKGLLLLLAVCAGCAPKVQAEGAKSPAPAAGASSTAGQKAAAPSPGDTKPDDSRKDTTAEPLTQQRVARALDPEPGTDRCGGYVFDGVSLGMKRPDVERLSSLVPMSQADTSFQGFEGRTYGFRAARPGRVDDVQIGFYDSTPPVVGYIHAIVLVAPSDSWPRTLFDRLGSPKSARVGEWIWWDLSCETTLRLSKIDALDGGTAQSYSLDVRRTLKPVGEAP